MGAADVRCLAQPVRCEPLKHPIEKAARFAWRAARNLLCINSWRKSFLFRSQSLTNRFWRTDANYTIRVFMHHYRKLSAAGFPSADKILEVGLGRNVGTSLLMWALNHARSSRAVTVVLWDAFPNTVVDADVVREAARPLLDSVAFYDIMDAIPDDGIDQTLGVVARGEVLPDIHYRVQALPDLIAAGEANDVALVYSQSDIAHIWHVADFWQTIIGVTKPGGWHSHCIDLADRGRQESNYIEMLEWSPLGYWLTMRFVPGAINRWRASMYMDFLVQGDLNILSSNRQTRDTLSIPLSRIDRMFRSLNEVHLRTTAWT